MVYDHPERRISQLVRGGSQGNERAALNFAKELGGRQPPRLVDPMNLSVSLASSSLMEHSIGSLSLPRALSLYSGSRGRRLDERPESFLAQRIGCQTQTLTPHADR
jgi:hypothetical protein